MKKIYFSILFAFCRSDDWCDTVEDCTFNIVKRLSALETKVGDLEIENDQLKQGIFNLESKVIDLEIENEELKNDVWELEQIVTPGKIPANCQEHADRGEFKNGVYQIKPSIDIEPFYVTCDFRK